MRLECHGSQKSHHRAIKTEAIGIDEADLQRGVHNTKLAKMEGGGLTIGSESLSSPDKESGCPSQLMGGKGSKMKKGWHRSSQNKRLFGEAWHKSIPPNQHKHPVTGLPPIMCLKSGDIWLEIGEKDEKESQPMVTDSNVLLPIRSNVQVSSRLHLFIRVSRNWLWVRDIILHRILRTLSSFRLNLSKKLCAEFTIQPSMWDLVNSLSSQQGR